MSTLVSLTEQMVFLVLTKCNSPLNYAALKIIKEELKANASAVPSNLSDGLTGHLGLVLSPKEMRLISAVLYVRHPQPAPLVICDDATQHEANCLREDHKELLRLFREMITLEKLLKN